MVSNYFLLPSASPLLAKMDCPSTLPLSQIGSNLPVEKEQRYLKNSSTYSQRTLPFDKVSERPLLFEASRHLLLNKSFFSGRTSCNPYAHCAMGPVGGQSGGSGSELMTAGG